MKSTGILTRKDFLNYLANGGSFNKPVYLNKAQRAKLDKDQLAGRKPIFIDGKEEYLDGQGYWTSTADMQKARKKLASAE